MGMITRPTISRLTKWQLDYRDPDVTYGFRPDDVKLS